MKMKIKYLAALVLAASVGEAQALTVFQSSPVDAWTVHRVTEVAGTTINKGVDYAPTPEDFHRGNKTFLGFAPGNDIHPANFLSSGHPPGTGMLFSTRVYVDHDTTIVANFSGDDGHYISLNHHQLLSAGFGHGQHVPLDLLTGWNLVEMGLYNGGGPSAIYLGIVHDADPDHDTPFGAISGITMKAPEPGTLLLMASAIVASSGWRRRRHRALR